MAAVEPANRLAVLVPAFQAAATVGTVVAAARQALPHATVYVIDDGSTDATASAAAQAGAVVLAHPDNRGKGAALATGVARALADGAETIGTLDADGQHPPEALPRLLAPVLRGDADLVLGARARTAAMPRGRRFTNWLSAMMASRIGAVRVPDAQTGFRVFSRRVAIGLQPLVSPYVRYDYEAAFLLAALRAGYGVLSVEIPTIYPGVPSHFRGWGDSWRLVRVFARYLFGGP
ncbi:MAG: glycosyltransferase family 2 protein [Gemmatimonadales bacterium]